MPDVTYLTSKEQEDFGAAMSRAKRELERFDSVMGLVAQKHKIAYDAYRAVGFAHEDALELCKGA